MMSESDPVDRDKPVDCTPRAGTLMVVTSHGVQMVDGLHDGVDGVGLGRFGSGTLFRRIRADLMSVTVPAVVATAETPAGTYVLHLRNGEWHLVMIAGSN